MDYKDFEDDMDEDMPICGSCQNEMEWEDCWQCGGEGGRDGDDLMAEDPLWYSPDDFEVCDICYGKGGYFVCHNAKNHPSPSN